MSESQNLGLRATWRQAALKAAGQPGDPYDLALNQARIAAAADAAVVAVAEWLRENPSDEDVEAVHGRYREQLAGFGAKLARLKVYRLTLAEELDPRPLGQGTVLEQSGSGLQE